MKLEQGRKLISLYAIDVFLDAHRERLPKTTAAAMVDRFRRGLAELELHVQTQSAAPLQAEGLTGAKDVQREALLRDHMAPIARIAKLEAPNFPALAPLKMPRGHPAIQKLLAHAAGMASVAQDYKEVFIAAGLPATFVEDLNAAVDSIIGTLSTRAQRRAAGAGATRGVKEALKACFGYKAVIDSFIESEASGDTPLLAHWRTVKRVELLPSRRKPLDDGQAVEPVDLQAEPIRDPARLLAAPMPDPLARFSLSSPMIQAAGSEILPAGSTPGCSPPAPPPARA